MSECREVELTTICQANTPEMIFEIIECAVDNGAATTVVGSLTISPTCNRVCICYNMLAIGYGKEA